ncbi:MAG: hypothetical protein FWC46_00990 [Actinomycetia bacterium]|nr:hypothetical protein [Actinomycetes bacterium]
MATNRHGETYPYFICLGRHLKSTRCVRQATNVATIERLVEDHYKTIQISPGASQALEGMISEIFARIDRDLRPHRRRIRTRTRLPAQAERKT